VTQGSIRIYNGDQHVGASRVDFVPRGRAYQHRTARGPVLTWPLAEPDATVERHDELDAAVPVQVPPGTGTLQKRRRRPCECRGACVLPRREQHVRHFASGGRAGHQDRRQPVRSRPPRIDRVHS